MSGQCMVVVGCQWGDEGKGKIVDVLAEHVDIVARYQGGANAGHTVHVGDIELVLHQIPSGILHSGKRCLLGNGVVLDMVAFFEEYDALAERGIDLKDRIGVSRRAHLLLPYHRVLDNLAEERSDNPIGTTGRGIGPAYEDKAGRRGLRVVELADPRRFAHRIAEARRRALSKVRSVRDGQLFDALVQRIDRGLETVQSFGPRLLELATDVGPEISECLGGGGRVLLEGAQGAALDLDHGTYPFVTSSSTTAGGAATGTGIGPTQIDSVLGVAKAYISRVGEGPLPTAFDPEMDEKVRQLGGEFGSTTGRPRRCGWFDAVLTAHGAQVNGLTGIAITKLDVLDTLPELRIATAYRLPGGELTESFPADTWLLDRAEPVYETLPGWLSSTNSARTLADLPRGARIYLDRLEELSGAPVRWVSVGTRRSQIIQVG